VTRPRPADADRRPAVEPAAATRSDLGGAAPAASAIVGRTQAQGVGSDPSFELEVLRRKLDAAEQYVRALEADRNYYRRRWPPYILRRVRDIVARKLRPAPLAPALARFGRDARVAVVCTGAPAGASSAAFADALVGQSRPLDRVVLAAGSAPLRSDGAVRDVVAGDWRALRQWLHEIDYVLVLQPEHYGVGPLWSPFAVEMAVATLASDTHVQAIVLRGTPDAPAIATPDHVIAADAATLAAAPEPTLALFARARAFRNAVADAVEPTVRGVIAALGSRGAGVVASPRPFPMYAGSAPRAAATALPAARGAIRALYVTQFIECGGADKGAVDLLTRVDPGLVDFHFLTTMPSRHGWEDRVRPFVRELCHVGEHLPLPCDARYADFVVEYVRRREIGLVHIMHSFMAYDALPLLRKLAPRVKVVDQCHILEPPDIMEGGHPAYGTTRYGQYIDHRTVTNEWLRRYLVTAHDVPESRISVIYTGVDWAEEFDPARYAAGAFRARIGVPAGASMVTFIGRLHWQKRPWLFVEIAAEVQRRAPELDVYFVVVGAGPERARLEGLRAAMPAPDRLVLAGEVPHGAPVLRDSDLLLMPSAHEGLAFVSYEAMAMRVPQIFTDVNAQSELVTPETGVLVPADEPAVVEEGTRAVVALLRDPVRREAMGRAARDRVREHFGVARMVEGYEALYRRLCLP